MLCFDSEIVALISAKIEGYEEFMGFTKESTIHFEGVEGDIFFQLVGFQFSSTKEWVIFVPGNVIGTRPTLEDQNLDPP